MPPSDKVLTLALVLCPVLATDARAQVLLEDQGVELRGAARLLISGAGTCNVLESDTSYETRKANHNAPMDVWRLDFSVRNGSGRWLDHLIARFRIESEWPDCTNWSSPDLAEFAPEHPAAQIDWAGTIGNIQQSGRNVVAPDATLTDTRFFIVLRGDPAPRFSNWSMDFDFAAAAPTAASGSLAAAQQPAPAPSPGQENLFWQSIMNSTNPAEFEAYLAQFPNGVFRALAEARLEELRAPAAAPVATRPRAGGAPPPTSGTRVSAAPAPTSRLGPAADSSGDFGDDSGEFANDGDCDDTRFVGDRGAAAIDNDTHIGRDATDCRNLLRAGRIRWGATAAGRSPAPSLGAGAAADPGRLPGEVFRDCDGCPEMVVLPDGQLAMGRYEVTVGEYRAFASATGAGAGDCWGYSWQDPGFPQTDRHPVTCVSWDDAWAYVSWLSRTTGATYRLPTEAEWDRAAAGSQRGCDSERTGNSGTCPVGSYGSNGAGLSDMVGNLWEWTANCWEDDCGRRVLRGCSWLNNAEYQRPGARLWGTSDIRDAFDGFRVARTLD